MAAACDDSGFFAVRGHGCSAAAMADAMQYGRAFFDEPIAVKEAHIVNGMRAGRGYEVSPEHHSYQAAVHAAAAASANVQQQLAAHKEASVGQGRMSERFLCGPDEAAAAAAEARRSAWAQSAEEAAVDAVRSCRISGSVWL